jgi:hypothetical protein
MFAPEKEAFFAGVQFAARAAANPVAQLIARDGAQNSRQQNPAQRQNSTRRENSCANQQGIAGQKKTYKQSGLNEDHQADERSAACTNQFF